MKKYKVIQVNAKEEFEASLNELSQSGWKVIASNFAFTGVADATPVFYALLESNPIEEELKQMLEHNVDETENLNLNPSAN